MDCRYRYLRFPEGKAKVVTFSYDDGHICDIRLSDLFTKYGLKATFNFNSYKMRDNGISVEDAKAHILDKGHEIAVHGAFHRAEGRQRPAEAIRDVLTCREELENTFGRIIRGMAYPDSGIRKISNCTSYETIKRYLTDLDIAYSRTLNQDNNDFELPLDWHAWVPTAHHGNAKLFDWIEEFVNFDVIGFEGSLAHRFPRLFYVWGHSFEFDRAQNWDRAEEMCQKLSGHDDIWYATNIEIYEYVTAYNSLVYSMDGKRVYNPTATKIWFEADRTPYVIEPGETITID